MDKRVIVPRHPNDKWDTDTKYKAVLYWFVYRSWGAVSRKLGVPITTIRKWARTPWWDEVIREIQKKYEAKLDATYARILDDVGTLLGKTLVEGQKRVDKDGNVSITHASAKELAQIAHTIGSQLAMLRGKPTSRTEKVDTTLDKLQEAFENRYGTNKKEEKEEQKVH